MKNVSHIAVTVMDHAKDFPLLLIYLLVYAVINPIIKYFNIHN